MEITTDVLDIVEYEKRKLRPATLIPRKGRVWLTRDLPIGVAGSSSTEWGLVKEGDVVRIPLFPYITRGTDPSIAIGCAFELGFKARDYVTPGFEVHSLHIALGHPVTEITQQDQELLRFWLGFGYVLKEI
jgi:hypothetical protein